MTGFPERIDQITPDWLTEILRAQSLLGAQSVSGLTATRIGEDQGFTGGGLYRLHLSIDAPAPNAPASMVAKTAPLDPAMRQTFALANGREVQFYRDFADPALPVPRSYFSADDPDTGASLILQEDLSDLRGEAFRVGLPAEDAMKAITALAQIHARWWNAPELAALSGAATMDDYSLADYWPGYPERIADILPDLPLPPRFLRLCDFYASHEADIFQQLAETAPLTCLHRDIQVDNILFNETAAKLIDWQFLGKGLPAWDVTFFCASSLAPENRRKHEIALLDRYHDTLGQPGYSRVDLDADYRKCIFGKISLSIAATMVLDNSSAFKRQWRRADLTRMLAFIEDHDITPEIY